MTEIMLETKDLTKQFGKVRSNDSISLHIKQGEIYGLVGRNGAGKTTLMKMICNMYTPTSGSVFIKGEEQRISHHMPIGALIEEPALMPNLSAYENILTKCYLMNIRKPKTHAKELLQYVKLENTKRKRVKDFSLGMRQRVGIALALAGWPEFILLDEPINGLDPQGILDIRDMILKIRKERNITFMISSHLLGELQKIADRFGIIAEGKLVKELSATDIAHMGKARLFIRTKTPEKAMKLLKESLPVFDNGLIQIPYENDEKSYEINKMLYKAQIPVDELYISSQKGEELFLQLMGGEHYV
ncbi:MAG: ATP-binding cassette domain-containing protein [Lachnospiraceae bacterium]|nr:ATP-binding cassette domain-containing protein [Lachnospiraceae bacterium]